MQNVITATYQDGLLKPDQPLDLPARARVRLIVEVVEDPAPACDQAWQEFEDLCDESPLDSGGVRLTRDQLHERR
jgi:predicted DNA-binding antitoxin AbrB/MazE fold protein